MFEYVPSETKVVQGKRNVVYGKYGKKWRISPQGYGNGNWLLQKRSDVLVNGVSYRNFILSYYCADKLTRNLAERFRNDVESGVIVLKQPS